jgi:hypothetical protein
MDRQTQGAARHAASAADPGPPVRKADLPGQPEYGYASNRIAVTSMVVSLISACTAFAMRQLPKHRCTRETVSAAQIYGISSERY